MSRQRKYREKAWLREQYVIRQRSQSDIAEECGVTPSTVSNWLKKFNIETRSGYAAGLAYPRLKDSSWLREQYVEKQRDMSHIAAEIGCSTPVVCDWLRKHSIETRTSPGGDVAFYGKDNPNWNGGPKRYGAGWNHRKKQAVRDRDGRACQDPRCSVTQDDHLDEYGEKLHVHHLQKARDVNDPEKRNAKDNLITLCRDCHRRWEKIADAGLVPEVKL